MIPIYLNHCYQFVDLHKIMLVNKCEELVNCLAMENLSLRLKNCLWFVPLFPLLGTFQH